MPDITSSDTSRHCPFCGDIHDPQMSCAENDWLDRLSIAGVGDWQRQYLNKTIGTECVVNDGRMAGAVIRRESPDAETP